MLDIDRIESSDALKYEMLNLDMSHSNAFGSPSSVGYRIERFGSVRFRFGFRFNSVSVSASASISVSVVCSVWFG